MLRFVHPHRDKIQYIVDNMRPSDVEELEACGWPPESLHQFARESKAVALVEVGGVPCSLFGVAKVGTLLTFTWSPWMIGSTELNKHRRKLLTQSKRIVQTMQNEFGYLENWVYEGSAESVRYLEWLGFNIEPAEPYGPEGQRFHKFWKGER